jgi:thiol-disulfide isomerase/thioredoxin
MKNKFAPWVIIILVVASVAGYFLYKSKMQINLSNGDIIENIELRNPEDSLVSLYSINNKYVLIQFWASWCDPCVREIPELIKLYEDYSGKKIGTADGFTIYAVSLDFDRDKWKNALKRLGIPWPYNVNDTKAFKSDVARKYNVNSIPTNVLINPKHEIVGVDLTPEQARKTLERFSR